MKIAFYIPVLNIGGAEKVIIDLLKELSKSSQAKYYLITDTKNSSWISEIDDSVEVLNVDSQKTILSRLKSIKEVIKEHNIQIVVSHLTHSNIHCLLLRLTYFFKLILVEHSVTSHYIQKIGKFSFLFTFLIRRLFRLADRVICVSQATRNDLIDSFGLDRSKCEVIYNPLDFSKIQELSQRKIRSCIVDSIKGRKYIVTIGRLETYKNHLFLIDALKDYLKRKNIVLLLVGGGSQKELLQSFVAEHKLQHWVIFTDYESNPYPYILKSSVLIHPSKFEGFGLVLVEALFLSRPVISMNFQTAYEVLENGKLGFIVKDKETMIAALSAVFDSVAETSARDHKEHVFQNYNVEKASNQYFNVFQSLLYQKC